MKKVHKLLDEISEYAGNAINGDTKEPLFYYIINPVEEIRRLTTPWWIRLWQRYQESRPFKDDEIPF